MFFNKENDGKGPPGAKRRTVPLLPLRDIIVFPHMVSQLFVWRERSINALDAAMTRDKDIFLAAQKNAKTNEPTPDDIAQAIVSLHQMDWVTGQVLDCDGGLTLYSPIDSYGEIEQAQRSPQ